MDPQVSVPMAKGTNPADVAEAETPEQTREVLDEMLQVFYDDGPWLHMYFQPDFYGVSNRVEWSARRDERVHVFEAALR